MNRFMPFLACAILALSLQGCIVAAIGAGVGAVKHGNAAKSTAATSEREKYGTYRVEMEKVNLEREKAGLQPHAIMSFEEWKDPKGTTKVSRD